MEPLSNTLKMLLIEPKAKFLAYFFCKYFSLFKICNRKYFSLYKIFAIAMFANDCNIASSLTKFFIASDCNNISSLSTAK